MKTPAASESVLIYQAITKFFRDAEKDGDTVEQITIRAGVMPEQKYLVCVDLSRPGLRGGRCIWIPEMR